MGNVLIGVGVFDNFMMADLINYTGPRPAAPAIGVTEEYGNYLVRLNGCRQCDGLQLSGRQGGRSDGQSARLEPDAPRRTCSVERGGFHPDTLRTGVTPADHHLSEVMPWKIYGSHNE